MFDNGISPDIKMFTSAESVISLSCLLTSSLNSSHVCNRFAGLIKKVTYLRLFNDKIHS